MFDKNKGYEKFENRIWLASPTMHGDELRFMQEAYETNWMSTVGANINELEENLAKQVGCKYAVALSSGTAALHLAIKLAGERIYGRTEIGKGSLNGHRVFCSDMTFDATVNPVVYEGGVPVFIDTEYDSWNMDPVALERAFDIYPEVKIIVLAHLYGTPAKVDEIRSIAEKHGALIVEDAAESLGATYKGVQTGVLGDYGCVSFNGNKIITGSSGGAFLTDSLEDANRIKKWSTQSRENAAWYQHEEIGYNYRMSNVIAGVVRGQLPYLEEHIAKKKAIYERYRESFKDLPVSMNPVPDECQVNYWLSCMIIDRDAMCKQVRSDNEVLYVPEHGKSCPTEILEAIASINAEGRPVWKPMHMQPMYRMNGFVAGIGECGGVKNDDCISASIGEKGEKQLDVGRDIFERGLCLPSDIKMTVGEQDRIVEVVRACFE